MARVADFSTKIRVSELTTGREVRTFEGGASRLCLSDDGRRLAAVQIDAGSRGSTLTVWDVSTGQKVRAFGDATDQVDAVAFAPDGRTLAVARNQNDLRLWEVVTGVDRLRFVGYQQGARPPAEAGLLAFSPDGRVLATGSGEPSRSGQVKLWDVATGKLVGDFKDAHSDAVLALDFSADGKFKVKMYSRSNFNAISSSLGAQTAVTTGVSLMHTQNFNEVKDLLRFARDKRRKEMETETEDELIEDEKAIKAAEKTGKN